MPSFFVEDNESDVVVPPKMNQKEGCEVGDMVTFPVGNNQYSTGTVIGVNALFEYVSIQPLAEDIGVVEMPTRVVVVQRKGVPTIA